MAEENKKKTTTKANSKNTKKTTTNKKTNNQNKKNTTNKKVNNTKKTTPKKQTPKKVTTQKKAEPKEIKKVEKPKKIEEPKVVEIVEKPKVVEIVEEPKEEVIEEVQVEETEETVLEKTLIFDGRENQNLAEVVKKLEEDNVVLDDKIIKRSKGKKIAVNILTILIFIIIIATIIFVICSEIEKETNSQTLNSNIFDKVSHKYNDKSEIDTNSKTELELGKEDYENIETITLGEFEKKVLEKEDMLVIITSTTCYYSIEYEPVVNELFGNLEKTIYRINITSLTEDEINRFRTYYAFTTTPTIFELKGGVVSKELVGQQDKYDLEAWLNQ